MTGTASQNCHNTDDTFSGNSAITTWPIKHTMHVEKIVSPSSQQIPKHLLLSQFSFIVTITHSEKDISCNSPLCAE